MWKASVATIAIVLALSGCADWKAYQATQESRYLGKKIDALYDQYGVPDGVAPTSDGGHFLEFRYFRGEFACTAKVTADSRGIITKIKVGGQNGCIMPLI